MWDHLDRRPMSRTPFRLWIRSCSRGVLACTDCVRMYIISRASGILLRCDTWYASTVCLWYDIWYVWTAPSFAILWVLCCGLGRDGFTGHSVLYRRLCRFTSLCICVYFYVNNGSLFFVFHWFRRCKFLFCVETNKYFFLGAWLVTSPIVAMGFSALI